MSVRQIVKMGVVSLLERSMEVSHFDTAELRKLIEDMWDTQREYHGAGLAAPQIGVNQRVIVFGFEHCERYPKRQPLTETVLINPEFEPLDDTTAVDWEGCLSVPGLRGVVERYERIAYWGFNERGEKCEREAQGFHARVVQHEIDHLNGVLFVHRLVDKRLFGFEDVLEY